MRATLADLLLRAGRDDEGMAELHALRPQLTRDPSAADAVADTLAGNGRTELAEQWLSAALETAIEAAERLDAAPVPDAEAAVEASQDAWEVVDRLALARRTVRRDLGLAPDEYDGLADELDDLPDMVFWPRAAFEALRAAHPEGADGLGVDWDAHRAMVERELQQATGEPLLVETATPQMLAAALAADPDAVEPPGPGPLLEWPPGRNDPCWCGSGTKYKKCCLPRARP